MGFGASLFIFILYGGVGIGVGNDVGNGVAIGGIGGGIGLTLGCSSLFIRGDVKVVLMLIPASKPPLL